MQVRYQLRHSPKTYLVVNHHEILQSMMCLVELRGLEPLTPCMPCRCATSCATAPNTYFLF